MGLLVDGYGVRDFVSGSRVSRVRSPAMNWSSLNEAFHEQDYDGVENELVEVLEDPGFYDTCEGLERPGSEVVERMDEYMEDELPGYAVWSMVDITSMHREGDEVSYNSTFFPVVDQNSAIEMLDDGQYTEFFPRWLDALGMRLSRGFRDEEEFRNTALLQAEAMLSGDQEWRIYGKMDRRDYDNMLGFL